MTVVGATQAVAASAGGWTPVCAAARLMPDRGAAVLVDGTPVAVFLLATGELHAIDNVDPFSGAGVLSRGIVGDCEGQATVASPMYKQRFVLATGRCVDDATTGVAVHDTRIVDGVVHVRVGRGGDWSRPWDGRP